MQQRELFNKIQRGEASPEEQKQFLQWLDSCDEEMDQYLKEYFTNGLHQSILWDEEPAWKRLRDRIEEEDTSKVIHLHKHWSEEVNEYEVGKEKQGASGMYWKVASVVLFISAFVILFLINQSVDTETTASRELIKSTEYGQKMSFYLPDGSKVILNSDSKLSFESSFQEDVRKVQLSGEAYFDVVKDPTKPFIVQTGDYSTKVLGTSFVINGRSKNELEVALRTGLVEISGNGSQGVLVPGEKMTINLKDRRFIKSEFKEIEYFGWTSGILYFQEVSFNEVVERLQQWYGVQITVENMPKADKKYSGRFENESLENVLQGLSFINHFDYTIKRKDVMIKFK